MPKERRIELGKAVARAFDEEKPELVDGFLAQLGAARESTATRLARSALLLLTLAIFFEVLISASSGSKVTIAGLEVGDNALVQRLLPPIFAFVFYELQSRSRQFGNLESLNTAMMIRYRGRIHEEKFDGLLGPRLPTFFDIQARPAIISERSERLQDRISTVLTALFRLLPLAFLAYSYYRLIELYGILDIWVIAGLVFVVPLVISAYALDFMQSNVTTVLG
jgi:hypothetical protein